MASIQKYNISILDNALKTLTVTPDANNSTISQYENVLIKVQLNLTDFYTINSGKVVILNISGPTTDSITDVDDFDYHIHLLPDTKTKGLFYLYLNEIIGRNLQIGNVNTCQFKFQVLTSALEASLWDTYTQSSTQNISLYKTNLDYKDQPDDLSNAFAIINSIIKGLEQ